MYYNIYDVITTKKEDSIRVRVFEKGQRKMMFTVFPNKLYASIASKHISFSLVRLFGIKISSLGLIIWL